LTWRAAACAALLALGCSGGATEPPAPAELLISEAAGSSGPLLPAWVELYNGTDAPKSLAGYRLAAGVRLLDGGWAEQTWALPAAMLDAKDFVVLSGKPYDDLWETRRLFLLGAPDASFWFAADGGPARVVLLDVQGKEVDSVSLAGLPAEPGSVLARGTAGFQVATVATPGGTNDAFDATDLDADGLPDSAERPGGTLAGLPLYAWGARENQRDVFVEIDRMFRARDAGGVGPGTVPRVEALARIAEVFRAHGVTVHFDVGALPSPDGGAFAGVVDLGGGGEIPWACSLTMAGLSGATSFYQLKAEHSDLRRRPSFHHVIFGHGLADVGCGTVGATGKAELGGNDVAITLGVRGYSTAPGAGLNRLINNQAATLMHELGHNLGLRHGGDEDTNFKPSYLSVMNYLYQLEGLPQPGVAEGDRYYYQYGGLYRLCMGPPAIASRTGLQGSSETNPAAFRLDYSDGQTPSLNAASLDETRGLGRPGSTPIDWDFDGGISSVPVSAAIGSLDSSNPVCPSDAPGSGVLRDFADWQNLQLRFTNTEEGTRTGAKSGKRRAGVDLVGDRQAWVDEQ